jgi:hypothetical protein
MSTALRISLLAALALASTACKDVKDFFRRLTAQAEDAVAEPAMRVDADALCEIANGGPKDFDALMVLWDPSTPYGEDLKHALQVVSRSDRYDMVVKVAGGDWSCPALEPMLEGK